MKGTKQLEVDGVGTVEISVLTGKAECFVRVKGHRKPLEVKALRKTNKAAAAFLSDEVKAIEGTLRDSKRRLESSWCSAGTWAWEDLHRCWFEHPLVFPLAQRLIWRFEGKKGVQEGLWEESGFTDSKGKPLGTIAPDARVSLWHPAHSPGTVDAWRRRWLEVGIEQPIRQAFREVYLVTDAERSEGSRSARFAGHILRQAQFAALCRERGWSVSLVGPFDSYSSAEKTITDHKVYIQWGGDPVGAECAGTFYRFVRMNAVTFKPVITNIPPIVFSEVLRDLDLFVSVASIGVDPSWESADSNPALQDYWNDFTSSDLSEAGKVRRDAIALLLPGFPTPDRFTLEKKHLVVQGTLGRYLIHLQSGAVFQHRGNKHICIVSKVAPSADRLALLVGDPMLSLIVSKALLLANDDKIKDRSIISQIQ